MFRFASAFLLLAVGSSAYTVVEAQEVTLKDGKTKLSWADFANAVNNPSQIKGSASQEAIDALDTAKGNLKTAQDDAKKKADNLTAAKNALQVKEDSLSRWEKQISTYGGLLSGYNSTLATYQTDLTTHQAALSSLNTRLNTYSSDLTEEEKNYTMELPASLKTIIANARAFSDLIDAGEAGGKVYYKVTSKSGLFGKTTTTLTLAFTDAAPETTGWTEVNNVGLYQQFGLDPEYTTGALTNFSKLEVYLGNDYKSVVGSDVKAITGYSSSTAKENVVTLAVEVISELNLQESLKTKTYNNPSEIARLKGLINDLKTDSIPAANKKIEVTNNLISGVKGSVEKVKNLVEVTTAKINGYISAVAPKTTSEQNELKADVQAKQALKDEADALVAEKQKAVDAAQTAHDKSIADSAAAAFDNYKTVNLSGDVTVTAPIANYDGTIFGNGHIINLGENVANVFDVFKGQLGNVAVNGQFAKIPSGATFSKVVAWANNQGTYYNEEGVKTANIQTISELGYLARENYGVNFADKKIVALTEASKVYSITYYDTNSTTKHFVQKNGATLSNINGIVEVAANRFIKSETNDLTGANIFYNDNTCPEVVITDKQSFYCPVDLNAAKVSYNRAFAAGKNAVCLPFDFTSTLSDQVEFKCTFEKEDNERFWFRKIAEAINAYTPVLFEAKAAFTLPELNNITIKATPATQIVEDEGDPNDASKSFGLLKTATREEFAGYASNADRIYGLSDGVFKRAAGNAKYPALRLVVYSGQTAAPQQGPAKSLGSDEKGIGILEEDGTTAIEDVVATATELNVAGAQGEIIITSEIDFGKVGIYSIDGRLAAMPEVKAGTTNVNVASGLYIVMGKKVLVK